MESNRDIKSHRDLQVWKASMDFAVAIYRASMAFPQTERFALANQMQRAAVSIPSNIAEGHARQSTADFLHFLSIAKGSLAEIETQLELSSRLGYIEPAPLQEVLQQATSIGRMLSALQQRLRARLATSKSPSP